MTDELPGSAAQAPADNRREERRQAILDAAEELFLEQGFERASVSAIVARSGGSLATVYELFGSKLGLLRAVVDRNREQGLSGIDTIVHGLDSAAEILTLLAHRLFDYFTSPRAIAFMRVVIAESLRDPEFARAFHRDVHMRFVHQIADKFRQWHDAGKARIDDADAAAELFLATVMCDAQLKAMVGIPPDPADRAGIDWRLACFMRHFEIV